MPIIDGRITPHGAVVDVMVGVGPLRERLLVARAMPVPALVPVRAVIDTGSHVTGFAARVFDALSVNRVGQIDILTPSTPAGSPFTCDEFDVSLAVVAGGVPHRLFSGRVITARFQVENDGVEAIIGRDVLRYCILQYYGPDDRFTLWLP